MSEEVKVQEQEVSQDVIREESIKKALWDLPDSPTANDIEKWKIEHGEVYVSALSEVEVFVFRPITRPEWVELRTVAADPKNQITELKFEELVCDTCVLWKSVEASWGTGKAGTPSILQEQILSNSNFMSPSVASMLVVKL